MNKKTAIIIGAGPAGLTAAYELLMKTDIVPIVLEATSDIGGISKTINYKGNRIDIGGHRFFSKSDVVMNWWQDIIPIQGSESRDEAINKIHYHNEQRDVKLPQNGPDPDKTDLVMLIRKRLSRIFFLHKFFDYPISLNAKTLFNLGLYRIIKIGWTYFWIRIFPLKKVVTLEDFFIDRFGKELYKTFFKDYTEKVWGVSCSDIPADWGAQRIKELSVKRAILHAIKSIFKKENTIEQKTTDTSLIERFLYPKYGPGQMWETVASIIEDRGGRIYKNSKVVEIKIENGKVGELSYINQQTNGKSVLKGDYYFSTMPVRDLINGMGDIVPDNVKEVSNGLQYRDFITVGLLLNKLKIKNETNVITINDLIPDNWIYIQERDVKIGRLQIFNNWSPYMIKDINKVWIGLEYFCDEGDELWMKNDLEFIQFAINELDSIGIIDKNEVIDSTIIRMQKTYPAYFGTYKRFNKIREFTDKIKNLFLIGRNGMHKYNNADHSMLTAMVAVDNVIKNKTSKQNIWDVNTEDEYHEEK